jgi:p-aminobenzoyl-glutamate transporter AbgT
MTAGVRAKPVQRSFMDRLPEGVERVGNKVPYPMLMFAYLILFIIVASTILGWLGIAALASFVT